MVNELNYLPYLVETFWQQTANSLRVKNILFVRASLLQQSNKFRSQRTISTNTEHPFFGGEIETGREPPLAGKSTSLQAGGAPPGCPRRRTTNRRFATGGSLSRASAPRPQLFD